jgi:hypothetical protein
LADLPLWTTFIAPAITLGVGIVAVSVAGRAIRANREIARNRATFDYIERTESTDFYQENSRIFHLLKTSGFENIFDPQSDDHKKQRNHVIQYLNHYENVSLAIQWGTLAEEIYYRAWRFALTADWETAKPIVENRRTASNIPKRPPNPRAYIEFEWLARRWATTEPLPGSIEKRRKRLSIRHLRQVRERAQLEGEIDNLRRRLDEEREERRRLTAILTDQKKEPPPVIVTPPPAQVAPASVKQPPPPPDQRP